MPTSPPSGRLSASARRKRSAAVTVAFIVLPLVALAAIVIGPGAGYAPVSAVSPNIVISQVYGGGGNAGATLKNDFIELFNRGTSPQSLNGWSVQYASATGTTWQVTNLTNVTLQPGQYYLVQEAAGAGGTTNLPTPDATGSINMSSTAGKVALVNTTTAITSGTSCPTGASIIDFVGFGTTANCFEGTGPTPGPSNTTAVLRASNGCTDTDQNATDFSAGAPNPRNTASPTNSCSAATPTPTPTPSLSINDVTQAEGDAGTTNFNFTVSLNTPAQTGGVSFTVNTADGTATAPSDYTAIVNGSGSIAEGNSSTQVTVSVNGDTTIEPNETFFVNITNVTGAGVTDAQGQGTITNDDVTLTKIHDIQGNGTTSPLTGQNVFTRGIVTAIKQGSSGGFFIQEPDATVDTDPNTSEGIFVFTGSSVPSAAVVGNLVQVNGNVQEFIPSADPNQHPETELSGTITASVLSTGNTLPAPVTITAADTLVNNLDNLERYEGMRVTVPSLTVVAGTQGTITENTATVSSNGVFYGVITGVARPFREPGVNASDTLPAGSPANVPRFDENPERIRIDSDAQPGTTALNVSFGSVINNVTGPLDYAFRTYTILPDTTLTATNGGPTPVPTPRSDEFTVASFNMERFFDTVADGESGAPTLTTTAFNNRLNKASLIVRNVQHYPDVIGVEEMENLSTLQQVAAKINSDAQTIDSLPNPNYVAYLVEGNDVGGIDVGFLVKESRVTTVDVTQIELAGCNHTAATCYTYTNPNTGGQELLNDRPPLVLRATIPRPAGGTVAFTVIVNHLRSLSSIDDDTTPNGTGTEGSRVRAKRKAQAEFLANYIQSRQTADPTEKIITVGDMNAFRINDGYVDVIGTVLGTPSPDDQTVVPGDGADLVNPDQTDLVDTLTPGQRYSYSFDGNAQVLDHVIVNPNALAILDRFAYARDDADQPVKDYENGTIPDRISDHDQPVAYFSLTATGQPQPTGSVLISEFRFRGPGAPPVNAPAGNTRSVSALKSQRKAVSVSSAAAQDTDEFVEFYNNTDSDVTVSTTDGSAGWALVAADAQVRFIIPKGTTIPARGHFLAASTGYSLASYAAPDTVLLPDGVTPASAYNLDIPDGSGLALFNTANPASLTLANRLDAAGYTSVDQLYREGTGFPTGGGETTNNLDYSFVRKMTRASAGLPQDTGDNVSDFIVVNTDGASTGMGQLLGAPGPENSTSPAQRNDQFAAALLDTSVSSALPPNRVRDQSDNSDPNTETFGTMSIRRTFTNHTGLPVTRLRFRIVEVTTFPSPGAGTADLRAVDSGDTSVTVGGGPVAVNGTTVEQPPTQTNGGGWNSSMLVGNVNLGTPLNDGDSVSVQFKLGVMQTGTFRFFINIEANVGNGVVTSPTRVMADGVQRPLAARQ